ncbi:hypothetical protein J3O30_12905 [Rhizobium sp. NZLR1]|nr:hypothetical protein J3O30_12905 [Rhizobium sp. NZLR1]
MASNLENDLASSLAEIEALKGITGKAACDIVVCPPFTLIETAVERTEGSGLHGSLKASEFAEIISTAT